MNMPSKKMEETLVIDLPAPKEVVWEVGKKASVKIGKIYRDCIITKKLRAGKFAEVVIDFDKATYTVPVTLLEESLASSVNKRFDYFKSLTGLVMDGKLKSLFVSGSGGLGKSFSVAEMIEKKGLVEHTDELPMVEESYTLRDGSTGTRVVTQYDYTVVKGYTTARALFDFLEKHKTKLIIIEDCDSALTDPTAQNILKAVLDTYERRTVSWMTKDYHAKFDFEGAIIFLSNKGKEAINQAIISRSVIVDLHMTAPEKIERLEYLLPFVNVAPTLTHEDKLEVLAIINKYKYTIIDLNVRTLIKALVAYEHLKDIDLVRYQVLQG